MSIYMPHIPVTSICLCVSFGIITMAFRAAPRILSRRLSTLAENIDKNAAKGPKLPAGNDPSAAHGPAHAIGTSRTHAA